MRQHLHLHGADMHMDVISFTRHVHIQQSIFSFKFQLTVDRDVVVRSRSGSVAKCGDRDDACNCVQNARTGELLK